MNDYSDIVLPWCLMIGVVAALLALPMGLSAWLLVDALSHAVGLPILLALSSLLGFALGFGVAWRASRLLK